MKGCRSICFFWEKVCAKELSESLAADVTYDSRDQLNGWPWDAALPSSLMRWIDLKGFDWHANEAYFVKSFSSIFSNLFFLCASEFARIGWDKDGGPFLFGRNKKTLLNHHACNPKKISAMTISSLAPCIWLKPIKFYSRSGCCAVMGTAALVINGTWGRQLVSWLRKDANSSFVVKNSAADGAEAGSGVMKIDWSNAGTSAGSQTSQLQIALKNGESTDWDCSLAMIGNTGNDYNVSAEIFFGAIYFDAIAAASLDVIPPWISFAEGANYYADNQAPFSGSTTQGSWNCPREVTYEEACDDESKQWTKSYVDQVAV